MVLDCPNRQIGGNNGVSQNRTRPKIAIPTHQYIGAGLVFLKFFLLVKVSLLSHLQLVEVFTLFTRVARVLEVFTGAQGAKGQKRVPGSGAGTL